MSHYVIGEKRGCGMKALIIIWLAAIIAGITFFIFANHEINNAIYNNEIRKAQTK